MDALARRSAVGLAQFIGALGILIFVPAWTLDFWQAWVYLFVFAVSAALITLYLWRKDPKLLERRLAVGPGAEKEKSQKRIQSFATAAFIGTFLLPSLDHRFSWSKVPFSIHSRRLFSSDWFFYRLPGFQGKHHSAGTIEVAPDQKVVSTGPYAWVRHPMYSGALIMLFGTPLALGSWWGLAMFIP